MSPALLSLCALLLVIAGSLTTRINVGILAIALAWPIALFAAHWKLDAMMGTFPNTLFLTLVGVSVLFGVAQANGTMEAVAQSTVSLLRGRAAALPLLFFLMACALSTAGPGAVSATALLAPIAMGIAVRAKMPVLLAALMVGNGANAGNLSPISAVGVIVHSSMAKIGLDGHLWSVWSANFTAHALAALLAWCLFGGPALLKAPPVDRVATPTPLTSHHWTTIGVIATWVLAVVSFKLNPGLAAFVAASALILANVAKDAESLKQVPWAVILMVCGVSVLIGVLEKTGGMDLFTTLLARIATPTTVNGTIAGITGLISTYSSTSGVVYPAFLPAVPGLVQKIGGGDPLQVAMSINVGAALVDVSPLSTIGALCIAALPDGVDEAKTLFRQLLIWGFSMTLAGALFCQLFIGFFA
ncbi:MAG: C4-dicarboxylate ABC transporter [Gemmatimonadaceae bacterium]|nr:C4-dicarboxylate ABC transporter [Gemmatimonadaceae bacterium]